MGLKNIFGQDKEKETIKLFEDLMKEMLKARAVFSECGDALIKGKFNIVKKKALAVSDIEHNADYLRIKIGKRLYSGAFMPIMRSRLYDLADAIDDIFDSIRDTANTFIYLQKRRLSKKIKANYKEMIAESCMGMLAFEKVVTGFFSGDKNIESKIKKCKWHEHNLDILKKSMFDEMLLKGKADAVTVWLITSIACLISSIGDSIEDCCDKLVVLALVKVI
jgi:predicted phosphate transport protein (TIGR00153 family)